MLTIWNPPLSKAFLGNPIDVHDVCNIPEYESWTVSIPDPLTLSNLLLVAQSNMLHFNFSQESTQLLFWVVSDFALSKAAKFKCLQFIPFPNHSHIKEKGFLSKNSVYIYTCM